MIANPAGLNGFEFLEFSGSDNDFISDLFIKFGFTLTGKHKTKNILRYQQGDINFLLNNEDSSQAANHKLTHGNGACSMGFKVNNSQLAFEHVLAQGATEFINQTEKLQPNLRAIEGIGGSLIYFCDESDNPYQDFETVNPPAYQSDSDLLLIDHLTHNVYQGNLDKWADFYIRLFNFHEIRFFNIDGEKTGLLSRAMGSPCGKIKIPLNESKDKTSQIEEFLQEYHGEGIQHIALHTNNIYESIEKIRAAQIDFLTVPNTYYDLIDKRINWHSEDVERMKKNSILIDGGKTCDKGLLLQIFTKNLLGPAFFEIIQRKGDEGFGEGNFTALFEAIERDQIERGVL